MSILKLGILGFGAMGHWHEENARKIQGVEIVSVCDISENKMIDAKEKGIKAYSNVDEFLKQSEINTVLISVPNYLHKEMAIKAAKAGKNIICEKPAALNVEEFDEMVKAAKDYNVYFTVHQNRRWDKDFRIAKEVYDKKELGNIFTIESVLHGVNGRVHDWHVYKKYGGGMMYDWGVHLIDQILMMVNEKVKTVYADIKNVINDEVDDYFKIILKFESGITAHIELGTYCLTPQRKWFICGDKGTLVVNGFECKGNIIKTTKLLEKLPAKMAQTAAGPTRSFGPPADGVLIYEPLPEVKTEWTDFYKNYVEVLKGNEEFMVKTSEVRRVLALMSSAFESSEKNKTIEFE